MMKLFLLIVVLTFTGCHKAEPKPVNNKFEPKTANQLKENVVDVNGVQKTFVYQVGNDELPKDEIYFEISSEDEIVITLPEGASIHQWELAENIIGVKLKSQRTYIDTTNHERVEGMSSSYQEFIFEITDGNKFESITFYKVNKDPSLELPPVFELTVNFTVKTADLKDEWGIQMTARDVTPYGLILQIKQAGGHPSGDLQTGEWYNLERKIADKWVSVEPLQKDVAYHEIAYIIQKNDITELEEDWKFLYGTLPEGEYRICKEILDFREVRDYDVKKYYAYFEVKE